MMQSQDNERVIRFIAVGSLIQSAEFLVPYPIPGAKLGLANIITLLAIIGLDYKSAFKVAFFRPIAASMIMGTFLSPTFVISFISSVASFFFMWLLNRFNKYARVFSLLGISIFGAVVHNLSQLLIVYLWLLNIPEIFYLAPILVMAAVISGGLVGYSVGYIHPMIDFNKEHPSHIPSDNLQKANFKDKLRLLTGLFLMATSIFLYQPIVYLMLNLALFVAVIYPVRSSEMVIDKTKTLRLDEQFLETSNGVNVQVLKKYLRFSIIFFAFLIFPVVFGRGISDGILYSNRIFFLFQISLWIMKTPIIPAVLWLFNIFPAIPAFLRTSAMIIARSMFLVPNLMQNAGNARRHEKKNLKGILNKIAELL